MPLCYVRGSDAVTTLYAIVKNLMVIIIMASFLELILPDGRLKPFVRFSVALFVLIAILSPCLNILFNDNRFEISLWDYQLDEDVEKNVQIKGEQLQQEVIDREQAMIQDKVRGQINAVTSLVAGVNDVQTQVDMEADGSIAKIELTVRPVPSNEARQSQGINVFSGQEENIGDAEREQIENKILQVISNLYGIPSNDVEIKFEGG